MDNVTVFIGQIINPKSFNELEVFPCGFIAVSSNGKIIDVGNNYDKYNSSKVVKENFLLAHQFLMPGFIDCHIHAPQAAQIGLGFDTSLLQWLNIYTFPLEAEFKDIDFAQKIYRKVVETTIKYGTTLASYFGTTSKESTMVLVKEILSQGQRAFVGKVCMDCNSPDYYTESLEDSVKETKEFVASFKDLESDLVKPTITPRFAVSCTENLMKALGEIAQENNLNIQSHISENVDEINFVEKLFSRSYAKIYDDCGLLTAKTIMAHGVHLKNDEIALLRQRGTSIAHCPASNNMLGSGLCDINRLLDAGIKVGLGTDVAGGNSMSIQDTILRSIDVSRHIEFLKTQVIQGTELNSSIDNSSAKYKAINYTNALFLATLGGAQALCVENITGNFSKGKDFDALLIDCSVHPLYDYLDHLKMQGHKSPETKTIELLQKFLYVGDDRNILNVFIAGKQVKI